jgi:hypothetical protein
MSADARPPRKKRIRHAWKTGYEPDEIAIGIALTLALHLIPVGLIFIKAKFPTVLDTHVEPPARTVIAAALLKLGKPLDPKQLPDRLVPQARTAPKKEIVASREDPKKSMPDAGPPPPPDTKDSDIKKLISKTDPFAEDAGRVRPEVGRTEGVEGGTETDPNKVHAGDMYTAKLVQFFHDRWQIPSVISQGEAARLCVTFRMNLSPRMVIWHLTPEPAKKSGNDLFDDSAREMLQKLLDDRTALPEPPAEVQDAYRGKALSLALSGATHGEGKCN